MKPVRLPWHGHAVPCAMLDILRGCNCVCKACYNRRSPRIKPLAEIEADLAVVRRARDLECVVISGGEPLLHPEIASVVRLIRAHGLVPALLTNGILWTDERAAELAQAGLALVFFHIQEGQRRPEAETPLSCETADVLLQAKCASAVRHGIEGAAILTVNVHRPQGIEFVLHAFRASSACSMVWMTLERELRTIEGRETLAAGNGEAEFSGVLRRAGWRPFGGLGGRFRSDVWRWMAYHAFARVDRDGRETAFASVPPSLFERGLLAALRLLGVKVPFRVKASRGAVLARLALNALTGGPVRNLGFALGAVLRRERIVPRHVIVESPPERLADGRIEYCEPCIDATVLNGRLVPPCLVDLEAERGAPL